MAIKIITTKIFTFAETGFVRVDLASSGISYGYMPFLQQQKCENKLPGGENHRSDMPTLTWVVMWVLIQIATLKFH
jgi:hypothetical protein